MFNVIFRKNEHGDVLFLLACYQHYISENVFTLGLVTSIYTHVDIYKKALIYNLHADNWYNVLKVKDFTERNIFSIRGSLVWVAIKTTCNMKLGSSVTALWLKVVYMLRL